MKTKNNGMSLVEVLVSIMAFGVIASAMAGTFSQLVNQQAQIISRNSMAVVTANLRRSLKDESGLLKTLFSNKNSIFDCLRSSQLSPNDSPTVTGCSSSTGTLTELLSNSGDTIINLADPTAGFTAAGKPCTGFGTTNPLCIARAKIDVTFDCDNSSCLKPDIIMTVSIEVLNDGIDGPVTTLQNILKVTQSWATINTHWIDLTSATVPVTQIPDGNAFKLVIIVDNSTSMLDYQNKLSNSLEPLFTKLHDLKIDLQVQVLSSTQYLMLPESTKKYPRPTNSSQQILNLSSVRCFPKFLNNTNLTWYQNGAPDFCDSDSVLQIGTQVETYELKSPPTATLTRMATDAEFTTFKTSVLSAITSVGVSGSDNEQSLCTLARLLTGPEATSFLKTNDKVGFILISNEQDNSTTQTCASEIKRKYEPGKIQGLGSSYNPLASFAVYYVKEQVGVAGYYANWTCSTYKDGDFLPYNSNDPVTFKNGLAWVTVESAQFGAAGRDTMLNKYGIDINLSCAASGYSYNSTKSIYLYSDQYNLDMADCPASVVSAMEANLCGYLDASGVKQSGKIIPGSCKIGCNDAMNVYVKIASGATGKDLGQFDNLTVNYCENPFSLGPSTSLTQEGTNVRFYDKAAPPSGSATDISNIVSYMNNLGFPPYKPYPTSSSCMKEAAIQMPWPSGVGDVYKSVFDPYPGLSALPIEEAITERAKAMFGPNNYFISAIIHPKPTLTPSCAMSANESVGFAFESLVSKTAKSTIVPVCADDYSPALTALGNYIETVIPGETFQTPVLLHQGEEIVKVYVDNGVNQHTFEIGGSSGVWPVLLEKIADTTDKLYLLDFRNTSYSPNDTDKVWVLIADKGQTLTVDTVGDNQLTYDQVHSSIRIGYGH